MDLLSPPILIALMSLLVMIWIQYLSGKSLREQLRHRDEVVDTLRTERDELKQTILTSGQVHAEQVDRMSGQINTVNTANEDLHA